KVFGLSSPFVLKDQIEENKTEVATPLYAALEKYFSDVTQKANQILIDAKSRRCNPDSLLQRITGLEKHSLFNNFKKLPPV
ncbi:hypothetical protein NL529_33070, partial [Klebsiella pneumoniae]|nr:hypothetical protein [Klebsiella pneumoniae]